MIKKIFLLIAFCVASVFVKAQEAQMFSYPSSEFNEATIIKILDESKKKGTQQWEIERLKQHLYKRLEKQKNNAALGANQKNLMPPSPMAANGPCTNIGFDNGSISGWTANSGNINGVTLPCNTCATNAGALTAPTTASNSGTTWTSGIDGCSGQSVLAPVAGNVNSICLNDNTSGGKMQSIKQTFLVSATNNIFTYEYLAVLEDGSHAATDQPYFFSQVSDGSGAVIPCTKVLQSASSAIAGWTASASCSATNYKGWVTVTLDLTSYIGQNVTIEFLVSDCNQGGHFGYAYVDAQCDQESTNNTVTICPGSTQLCGQAGFTTYSWSGPVTGNTMCLNTSTPGAYVLTCTGQCPAPIRNYTVVVSPTPTVNFSYTVTPCNSSVPFTDLTTVSSGTVTNWGWTFTGGTPATSTAQNPTIVYSTPGTYNAVLTCTSSTGCTGTYSTTVTIGTGPVAAFSASTVCPGNPTVFTNTSTGATGGYTWDFGEPASGAANTSAVTNPSHTYAGAGNYIVTLSAMGTGTCVAVKTLTVVVSPVPTATIGAPPVCLGAATTFTSAINPTAGSSYAWNFGDAGPNINSPTPSHTYATANTFPVTVTVTAAGGCTVTATTTVTVNALPTATFTVAPVCQGTASHFDATASTPASATYSWSFGGAAPNTDVQVGVQTDNHTYTSAATFPVTLVVTVGTCSATTTANAVVNPMPVLSITTTPACDLSAVAMTNNTPSQGTFTVWAWTMGDGIGTSTLAAPGSYTYPAPGIYTVTLTASTATGCSGTATTTAIVHPNPSAGESIGFACLGGGSSYDASSSSVVNPTGITDAITTYTWSFGDGTPNSNLSVLTHTYATCGSYSVSIGVTTNFGCTDVISGLDTVYCLPHVVAPPSFSICPGTPVASTKTTFTTTCAQPSLGFPIAIYFVNNPNPTTNTTTPHGGIPIADTSGINNIPNYPAIPQNLTCNLLVDTVYGYAVTNIGGNIGCIGDVATFTISVYPTPTVTPISDQTVCAGGNVLPVNFTGCPAAGETFTWTTTGDNVGLAATGAGNIPTFPGQNPVTPAAALSTVSVTPLANNCSGPPITFNITVNPIPTMTVTSPPPYCPSDLISSTDYNFNTNIIGPGLTYSFTATNTVNTGMPVSGINLAPNTAYNAPANASQINQLSVVSYTPSMNGCIGPVATNTITIKPTPIMQPLVDQYWCPAANTTAVTFATFPVSAASTYNWSYTTPLSPVPNQGTINPFPSLPTLNPGQTPLVVTVSVTPTLNGCVGPPSGFNITVYPNPTPKFTYNKGVCEGQSMVFTDLSKPNTGSITVNQWGWDMNNDGLYTEAATQNPTFAVTPAGLDSVGLIVFTSSNPSCWAVVKEAVYVNPNPVPDFVGDSLKRCPQLKTTFTNLSTVALGATINSYNWTFGNGNTSTSITPVQQTYTNSSPTQSAYYTVSLTVKTDSGCVNTKTKTNYIQVYPRPIADFGWGPVGTDIDAPTIDFVNQSIGASGYPAAHPTVYGAYGVGYYLGDVFAMNQNSNNVFTNAGFSHTYEYYEPYTYYVTQWVVNSLGCKDSITKPVEILPNFTFYIPNAFSPNGDGANDGFKGTGVGIDNTTYNLWVFDRWGMMIFYADDLEKPWDGHMKGSADKPVLQEDVYVWKVKFSDFRGKKHEYHGTVTLLK
jgi:gliding motility-associated-like protein